MCNSDENTDKEVKYLQLLRRHRIAGLIVATLQVQPAWTEALCNLAERIPVVVLGTSQPSEKVVMVTIDDVEGFVKATSHLLDLGHDRIGMIMPTPYEPADIRRVTGFLKAHTLRGKEVPSELLVSGGWHVKEGQDGAARLMELPIPPTAIVAPNDMAAIGAITKLKELGRRVPEDVAVVGYDNIAIAEWYDPALTTVDQPHYQMGQRAMQAMLKRLENPSDPAEVIKFETSLIIRRSSGAPRKASSGGPS